MRNSLIFILTLIGVWLCAIATSAAFQQSIVPAGPSTGGFGFECDRSGGRVECECSGEEDCQTMADANVCEQVVIVTDGVERSVDIMKCEGDGDRWYDGPRECSCFLRVESANSWLEFYQLDSAVENAPSDDNGRRNEVVPARRGIADRVQGEAPQAERARNRRDHRDDN